MLVSRHIVGFFPVRERELHELLVIQVDPQLFTCRAFKRTELSHQSPLDGDVFVILLAFLGSLFSLFVRVEAGSPPLWFVFVVHYFCGSGLR